MDRSTLSMDTNSHFSHNVTLFNHRSKLSMDSDSNFLCKVTLSTEAEWVARQTAKQEVSGSNPSIPPLLKHACGEGDWLLCWHYTPAKGVALEVNLRERMSRTPPHSLNKAEPTLALKPRGDVTRSPKQGYQWPHKWTCVQQKFFLKKKKKKKKKKLFPQITLCTVYSSN